MIFRSLAFYFSDQQLNVAGFGVVNSVFAQCPVDLLDLHGCFNSSGDHRELKFSRSKEIRGLVALHAKARLELLHQASQHEFSSKSALFDDSLTENVKHHSDEQKPKTSYLDANLVYPSYPSPKNSWKLQTNWIPPCAHGTLGVARGDILAILGSGQLALKPLTGSPRKIPINTIKQIRLENLWWYEFFESFKFQ